MDKLFRFTKIAAICCLVLTLINGILGYTPHEWWNSKITTFVYAAIVVTEWVLLILFCSMIYNNSVAKSPLRIPSLLGVISAIVGLVNNIFSRVLGIMQMFELVDTTGVYPIYITNECIGYVVGIGLLISFIWMSKYMKSNFAKAFSISYVILLFIGILFSRFGFRILLYVNDFDIIFNIHRMICATIDTFETLVLSIFYYSFYKMFNN